MYARGVAGVDGCIRKRVEILGHLYYDGTGTYHIEWHSLCITYRMVDTGHYHGESTSPSVIDPSALKFLSSIIKCELKQGGSLHLLYDDLESIEHSLFYLLLSQNCIRPINISSRIHLFRFHFYIC